MKASEVLSKYEKGVRDFRNVNLKGQSFKKKTLSEADFSYAQIEGTDFTGTILKGVKFIGIKAGLQTHQTIRLVIVSLMLSALSGLIAALGSGLAGGTLVDSKISPLLASVSIFLTVLAISAVTIQKGLGEALAMIFVALLVLGTIGWTLPWLLPDFLRWIGDIAVILAWGGGSAIFEIVFSAFWGAAFGVVLGIESSAVLGSASVILVAVIVVTIVAWIELRFIYPMADEPDRIVGNVVGAVAIVLFAALLGGYSCWQILSRNEKYTWFRKIAIAFAARGGTSFNDADLTDVDFTEATLKSTDLRARSLTRTYWRNVKKVVLANSETTYLQDEHLRQLVITGKGQNKNFDRQNLQYLNLRGANLVNVSLIDTALSQANLQGANLSGAILVRTKLELADLTDACLTGACIQDWSVTRSTKLDCVRCEYVFVKLIDGEKRDQVPSKGTFKKGEFILFVRSILDTLDLYHDRDVNPRAAVIVLKSLAESYQEPLEIVGLEKRGNGMILKLKISEFANREQLRDEYYSRYDKSLALSLKDPSKMLPQNEVLEARITELVEEVKQHPTTSIKHLHNHQGIIITGGSHPVNIEQQGNIGIGVNQAPFTTGNVGGTIYETPSTNLTEVSTEVAAEIRQLLEQLSQTYPINTISEQMIVAAKVIKEIENDRDWKQRVRNAFKEGSLGALEKAIDNPVGAFISQGIKGWLDT